MKEFPVIQEETNVRSGLKTYRKFMMVLELIQIEQYRIYFIHKIITSVYLPLDVTYMTQIYINIIIILLFDPFNPFLLYKHLFTITINNDNVLLVKQIIHYTK